MNIKPVDGALVTDQNLVSSICEARLVQGPEKTNELLTSISLPHHPINAPLENLGEAFPTSVNYKSRHPFTMFSDSRTPPCPNSQLCSHYFALSSSHLKISPADVQGLSAFFSATDCLLRNILAFIINTGFSKIKGQLRGTCSLPSNGGLVWFVTTSLAFCHPVGKSEGVCFFLQHKQDLMNKNQWSAYLFFSLLIFMIGIVASRDRSDAHEESTSDLEILLLVVR